MLCRCLSSHSWAACEFPRHETILHGFICQIDKSHVNHLVLANIEFALCFIIFYYSRCDQSWKFVSGLSIVWWHQCFSYDNLLQWDYACCNTNIQFVLVVCAAIEISRSSRISTFWRSGVHILCVFFTFVSSTT